MFICITSMNKDIFKLSPKEKRAVRQACKIAFPNRPDMVTAMYARPKDAMRLVREVFPQGGAA